MNTPVKSLVRHALTAIGTILTLIGLNSTLPVIEFLQQSLDSVWDAVIVIVGFVTTVIGFFIDKNRLNTEKPKTE